MPPHPLTSFEIEKCYQNEPKFNGVYSKKKKMLKNLYEYKSIGTNWIAFYVNAENVTHFGSFAVERIQKKLESSIEIKIL